MDKHGQQQAGKPAVPRALQHAETINIHQWKTGHSVVDLGNGGMKLVQLMNQDSCS